MKKFITYLFALLFVLASCSKAEIRQAQVLTPGQIAEHNKNIEDSGDDDVTDDEGGNGETPGDEPGSTTPETPVEPEAPGEVLPSDPNNTDRITDGSAYFVRQVALGLKDGSSWNNAMDANGLRELIAQKLNSSGTQDQTPAMEHAQQLDGAKIYMASGTYLLAEPSLKYVKMEWSGYSKQVSVSFYGGYAETSSGIDLSQRNVASNPTIFTGDANGNNNPDAADYSLFIFGNQTDILFDGLVFANIYRQGNGAAINASAGQGNSTVKAVNCTFRNIYTDDGSSGAAVYLQKATVTLENCTFQDNRARNGAAVNISRELSKFKATNCKFSGNVAVNCGGSILMDKGEAELVNCTFSGNSSQGYAGGAIHMNGDLKFTCSGCTFENNQAANNGAAVSLEQGTATINSSTFKNNRTVGDTGKGGIVVMLKANGVMNINGSTFTSNVSSGVGASIFLDQGRLYMNDVKINKNTTNNRGIVRLCNGICFMNKVSITDNTLDTDYGSAIAFTKMGALCANNLTIANNVGKKPGTDATINGGSNAIFVNSTIVNDAYLGVYRTESQKQTFLLNSIVLNTRSGSPAIVFGGDATVTSLGGNIVGTVSGSDGTTKVYTPLSGDVNNANFSSLGATWDASNYIYKWNGTLASTKLNSADFESKIKSALSGVTVTGEITNSDETTTTVFTESNIATTFYNWVTGISSTAFTTDALGTARGTAAWPGSYQGK